MQAVPGGAVVTTGVDDRYRVALLHHRPHDQLPLHRLVGGSQAGAVPQRQHAPVDDGAREDDHAVGRGEHRSTRDGGEVDPAVPRQPRRGEDREPPEHRGAGLSGAGRERPGPGARRVDPRRAGPPGTGPRGRRTARRAGARREQHPEQDERARRSPTPVPAHDVHAARARKDALLLPPRLWRTGRRRRLWTAGRLSPSRPVRRRGWRPRRGSGRSAAPPGRSRRCT